MVSQKTIDLVKATAPILKERGEEITRKMYQLMFESRPEYRLWFETTFMTHVDGGSQPNKLAGSIYAYAIHIDKLDELKKTVEKIANRHVDSQVIAEQYPVIGDFLLLAMKEVLQEQATPEIMAAWEEAYTALADIFIQREKELYQDDDVKLVASLKSQRFFNH
ncbi:globin domain-containing protein [Aphanothece sacrum]|uniref:Nitric oxide dioxygenase n=1 Tax=Aphanothece sacrum FPU1 TaxID=1920663 RepID=A0A401IGE0_APHSA|nr:globin domain-containing protein [Aphanothece sacrum]GBF80279.1 nitric oxide dioxygenase [Aphanothece sacrum FPU1]GBF83684.1 nitric oxide dioxygenase [Aphanothece sacrum FPU3]